MDKVNGETLRPDPSPQIENRDTLGVPLKGYYTGPISVPLKGSIRVQSFRKLGVPYLGSYNKDPTIQGTTLGASYFRKLPCTVGWRYLQKVRLAQAFPQR